VTVEDSLKVGPSAELASAMEYQNRNVFYAMTKVDWAKSPFHPSLIEFQSINNGEHVQHITAFESEDYSLHFSIRVLKYIIFPIYKIGI